MLISEMQEKQRNLDEYIAEKKHLGNPYDTKHYEAGKLALYRELGEFAEATKCFKTWSNKGPEPKERILDEMADCLHFMLKMMNFEDRLYKDEFMDNPEGMKAYVAHRTLVQLINKAFYQISNENWLNLYYALIDVCIKLRYTKQEVEETYLKKLGVNYKRQEENY